MTDVQENKLSMYLAVQRVCASHHGIWDGLPAFVDAFMVFEGGIEDIRRAHLIQGKRISGIAANKREEKEEMIDVVVVVAGALYAYACNTGDHELRVRSRYNRSQLRKSRDTVLRDICQLLHDTGLGHLAELGDYGVDAAVLDDLQGRIDDFAALMVAPRRAIIGRAEATSRLVDLFRENDRVLKDRLDRLVIQFKDVGAFYGEYFNARIIVDL